MPDLENLKKQAKLLVRWHRERHYPVAAQIRALMPRFLNMLDLEILAASFKLSDAQEMVARQHGFNSCQALKTGLSTTSRKVKSSPSKATIVGAEPQLFVADIRKPGTRKPGTRRDVSLSSIGWLRLVCPRIFVSRRFDPFRAHHYL